ncbi:hypothetical protein MET9862_05740 [Methylobacterium symbioticum]|uniref:Uncharacterized protein n=1 Tax=Methylobacterium symbioticum TaxID=2584084 RepID=A0A509ELR9_9HYPH|nr:hypothetical protein MET9862_05740 [Methylobacterium symbioticum]
MKLWVSSRRLLSGLSTASLKNCENGAPCSEVACWMYEPAQADAPVYICAPSA